MRVPRIAVLACFATTLSLAGCANVSPVQRGTLAKPEMQFDFDPANARVTEQTYASKEEIGRASCRERVLASV